MILHEPVLLGETVEQLAPAGRGVFVDCTVGTGGHTEALLEAGATRVLGLDRDAEVLLLARQRLAVWKDRVELVHADYRRLDQVLDRRGIEQIDGALADLGHSSVQLDAEGRGFSFRRADPLDMRMDRSQGRTLAELPDEVTPATLADVIVEYGEERRSRRVARGAGWARAPGRAAERAGFTEQRRGQRWRFTLVERPKGGFEADNLELLFDDPPPPGR